MSPETGRLIELNSLLIPDQKFFHLLPNQIKILQPQIRLPAGKRGYKKTPARDSECWHLDPTHTWGALQFMGVYIWTQPIYCNWWVFTSRPSPVIAPPTSTSKFHHFYHNQTSEYAVAKVFTSGPSQAAAIITIPEEIKIKI